MRLEMKGLWAAAVTSAAYVSAYTPASTLLTDALAAKGLVNLAAYELKETLSGTTLDCSLENAVIRKEW